MTEPRPVQRIDKWLFCARFFKTRALSSALVSGGKLRLNGARMSKPGHAVGLGDVLTFPQGNQVRVIRVLAPADRRGPASEARLLFDDLAPAEDGSTRGADTEQPAASSGED